MFIRDILGLGKKAMYGCVDVGMKKKSAYLK